MRHAWITDSVLCSAKEECGKVDHAVERECCRRFLQPTLTLFPNAVVAALGKKAGRRMAGIDREIVHAYAAAPPGCNNKKARASWQHIADLVRSMSAR
ncbi:MAG: hypothetical protein PHZ00_01225 [Candidatus Peribacteraceae bacterium]|nr:hypothetical protein [Candidatus Peribacteraceae bacterium]